MKCAFVKCVPVKASRFPVWIVALAATVVGVGSHASATVIAVTSPQSLAGTFAVSATDLVNSDQATFSSLVASNEFSAGTTMSYTFANNGAKDYIGASNNSEGGFGSNADGTYTFTLNTTLNPLGYEINSINVLSGFDGRRLSHNYTVAVSFVGDGSFTDLIRVPLTGTNQDSGTQGTRFEQQTVISDDLTGILATGVDQIRFTFRNDAGTGPQTVFREIDVFGVAVPEPSSLAMLLLGSLMLLAARRKRT